MGLYGRRYDKKEEKDEDEEENRGRSATRVGVVYELRRCRMFVYRCVCVGGGREVAVVEGHLDGWKCYIKWS